MMKKKIFNIIKNLLLFIFFFFCLQLIYYNFSGDTLYNYGFSYAIRMGEVPYRDFNMIIPPFGPIVYTIPLLIKNDYLMINLFQSLLLCLFFNLMNKYIGRKSYIVLLFMFIYFPLSIIVSIFPNYNFILLFLCLLLIYLEDEKCNDYLFGIILGLTILTKHNVGFVISLCSLYYINKDRNKFIKRLLGALGVGVIFIIYLLFTGSFNNFVNLCILGMFDFTNSNSNKNIIYILLFFIILIYLIIRIIRDRKSINNYYLLAFYSVVIPLLDLYHFSIFSIFLLIVILKNRKFKYINNYSDKSIFISSFMILIVFSIMWCNVISRDSLKVVNHFSYVPIKDTYFDTIDKVNDIINNNSNRNIIMLGNCTYFYKIINNKRIIYYDLINYGNHGYNGTNKIIEMIKGEKDPLFIVDINEYNRVNPYKQFNTDIVDYVLHNYNKIKNIGRYIILE